MIRISVYLKSAFTILLGAILVLMLNACGKKKPDALAPYRNMTEVQIFNQGEHQLTKHQWKDAIKTFQAFEALYPFGPYSEQAELDLIYAYYKKGDIASGLAETDRFIRLYPRSDRVDYVYYMKGILSDQQGLTWLQRSVGISAAEHDLSPKRQAFLAYEEVVTRFPQSPYAPDSALRMIKIRNLFAHKQVMLAKFYLERKAYVAAINHASDVVQHYNGSPEVVDALAILVQAYRGADLNQMADNTLKILQTNYPNSPQLKSLKNK